MWIITIFNHLSGNGNILDSGILGALAFTLLALCGLPAIYSGALIVLGKEDRRLSPPSPYGYLFIFLFPLAIIVGYLAYVREFITIFLAPLAQILAATAGVVFAIQLARQKGAMLPRRRFWGHFVTGLWVVPMIALVAEIIILIPTLIAFAFGAMTTETGRELLELLSGPVTPSVTMLEQQLEVVLLEPWFIITILTFFALLVPIIEEVLKTIVVWPIFFRRTSSFEALMGGIIGGAGYALFEAIFLTQDSSSWFAIMIGRTGATMMHAFTTGIACWGLAEGFIHKRWKRLLISYFVAVSFHGLWNAITVAVAISDTIITQNGFIPTIVKTFSNNGPIFIIILSMVAVFGIPWITRKLPSQSDESPTSSDDTGPILARDPRRM
jgi:hypothetical protein